MKTSSSCGGNHVPFFDEGAAQIVDANAVFPLIRNYSFFK